MSNRLRRIITLTLLSLFLFIILLPICFNQLLKAIQRGYEKRAYTLRFRDCDVNSLLYDIKNLYKIEFPSNITDVHAAKNPPEEGNIGFIVRFSYEPNSNSANKAFDLSRLGKYCLEYDYRIILSKCYLAPDWFIEPIKEGKIGTYSRVFGDLNLYIDTADPNRFIVYIHGFYPASYQFQNKKELEYQNLNK
jgi:hypothetical protein